MIATMTQRLLAYGLKQTNMTREEQIEVFACLQTEEQQCKMILFLKRNEGADAQMVVDEVFRIIKDDELKN